MTDERAPLEPPTPVGSDRRGLTFMLGRHPLPGFDVLFRQLLNALAISGHAITHASGDAAGQRIEIALDGHLFTLTGAASPADLRKPRARGRPAAPVDGRSLAADILLHRPDLPLAGLPAARLGLAVLRHDAHCRVQFSAETPESEAAAFLHALLDTVTPDAVLWEPNALVLSASELLEHTPATLEALSHGDPLPLPHPRYERPETLNSPPRPSVFARNAPDPGPETGPDSQRSHATGAVTVPTAAEPAIEAPAPAARRQPPKAAPVTAPPTAASKSLSPKPAARAATSTPVDPLEALAREMRNDRSRHRDAAPGPMALPGRSYPRDPILKRSRRAAVVISSSLCDGLTVAGGDGSQRVIATLPLTTSLGIGLSMLILMLRTTAGAV